MCIVKGLRRWSGGYRASRSEKGKAAYAKNGESRNVPMHDVLTTTLKAVKMEASTKGQCSGRHKVDHTVDLS